LPIRDTAGWRLRYGVGPRPWACGAWLRGCKVRQNGTLLTCRAPQAAQVSKPWSCWVCGGASSGLD